MIVAEGIFVDMSFRIVNVGDVFTLIIALFVDYW